VNFLLEVCLDRGRLTTKRYFTRSMGAITVLLTTPATPPEMKLLKDLDPRRPYSLCPAIFFIIILT
jgi:hypothetical protein